MTSSASSVIGRSPDDLTIQERHELAGQWIALEMYSPATLPLRLIAAIGRSPADCAAQLRAQGLDPSRFEFNIIKPAYFAG